jgi:hypothetical protein
MKTSVNEAPYYNAVSTTEARFKLDFNFQAKIERDELVLTLPSWQVDHERVEALLPTDMDRTLRGAAIDQVYEVIYNASLLSVISSARIKG